MAQTSDKPIDLATIAPAGVLAWEAPEFIAHERGWQWVVGIWGGALLLGGLAIWGYDLSFVGISSAIVLLLAALALTVQSRVKPKLIRITIEEDGVTIAGRPYPWEDLKGFWLVYESVNQALYIETNRRFLPILSVQLGKSDPEAIRAALLPYLAEQTDRAEEFADRLGRIIKF